MKSFCLGLLLTAPVFCAPPTVGYSRSFPGSDPAYFLVQVDRNGALEYKESPTDDNPLKAQLQEAETNPLFAAADSLNHFKVPLESGLKVANTGKKTFRYEDENGGITEATFNYSTNEVARGLVDRFENIAASEHAYLELDRTAHYDKLGVNDALADIEALWVHKQLAAPQQFIPLLTRISTHESYMHLVRDRAARLKSEFQGASSSASASADPKQK